MRGGDASTTSTVPAVELHRSCELCCCQKSLRGTRHGKFGGGGASPPGFSGHLQLQPKVKSFQKIHWEEKEWPPQSLQFQSQGFLLWPVWAGLSLSSGRASYQS